ncbi:MAG: DUF2306 domain-containing protein [Verrucomicrobiales bacterium]
MSKFFVLCLAVAFFLGVISVIYHSADYFTGYATAPFVLDKGAIALQPTWRIALFTHVISGIFCISICALQLSKRIRTRAPRLHRRLGKWFAGVLLFAVLPSGFYLAIFATGGVIGRVGFFLNGFLALCFTISGLLSYRKRHFADHGAWMIRAFAMIAAAISFRYLHAGFDMVGIVGSLGYITSLWGAILLNYIAAELVIWRIKRTPIQAEAKAL